MQIILLRLIFLRNRRKIGYKLKLKVDIHHTDQNIRQQPFPLDFDRYPAHCPNEGMPQGQDHAERLQQRQLPFLFFQAFDRRKKKQISYENRQQVDLPDVNIDI